MKLKVLFLSHGFYPHIGGIETVSEILANQFSEAGHEVHLLTWSTGSDNRSYPFVVIRKPDKIRLFQEHAWAEVVFENNPCLRLAWPCLLLWRPSIIVLHTWIARTNGKIEMKDRLKLGWWLKRATRIIAVSAALRSRCRVSAAVIGNPYNAQEFRILPGFHRKMDFVFLGRLVSDKGANHTIEAISKLIKLRPDRFAHSGSPVLTIIGDGPERENLERLVVGFHLENFVRFTGALSGEALVACLNQHRFLLVPSVWEEPFGIVALEGMACGCVPIVSDGGGLPDAVGKAGVTFQRGNVDSLVSAISDIIDNRELEQELRNAGTAHLLAYHPGVIARKYLTILEEVANSHKN